MLKRSSTLVSVFGLALGLSSIPAAFAFEFDKKLLAPDGAAGDFFGTSVSLDGNIALVGSDGDDDNGASSGSAYLLNVTTNNVLYKLTAPNGAANDEFGESVSLSDNIALVGSRGDDDNGNFSGSAYLFDVTTGNLLQKLTAPDGIPQGLFGTSVSLDGNIALVGSSGDDDNGVSSGSAYLFDVTTGSLLHKLTAPDGTADDQFGFSVSLYGNTALVGSWRDDDTGTNSGSAYLFDAITGNFLQKLTAPDGADFDFFGYSVSLYGDTALVGSWSDDDNGADSGSAYLFDVTTGDFQHKLIAPDGVADDRFGFSVSLHGNSALVGSWLDDDNGTNSGSAYRFNVTTGDFQQKLTAPDGAANDWFGRSVSLSNDTALIGSFNDDDNGSNSGSVYVFKNTSQSVPEPSMILGLFAVGSLGAWLCKGKG